MKSSSIFCGRQSMLGDIISYLPVLTLLEKLHPNSYKIFSIAKKCAHIVPLLLNQKYIDRFQISQPDEGLGAKDISLIEQCNYYYNVNPQHREPYWYNSGRHMIEENTHMLGLEKEFQQLSFEERTPKLEIWFDVSDAKKYLPKTMIAIWPCAANGKEHSRNPSRSWYKKLIDELILCGFRVGQFGHPNDFNFNGDYNDINYINFNNLPFFDQVKLTLGMKLVINTDSGSGLIFGAYNFPQITLLTNHGAQHRAEFGLALSPRNNKNINFFAENGCDNIKLENVIEGVKNF